MHSSRLYAGTVMLIAAVAMRLAWHGDWTLILLVILGMLLVLASFAEEGTQHG